MRNYLSGPRLLSRPLGIEWAGWRSTTAELQAAGWDIAAEFDYYRHTYRLLLKHEACDLYALSSLTFIGRDLDDLPSSDRYPVFQVRHVARALYVQIVDNLSRFVQIDARPQVRDVQIRTVEDFNIFALVRNKAEEILVDRANMTVVEHLEAIKRLQEPKQKEIRQRMLREGSIEPVRQAPKLHLVANIIHCEEAA